MAMRDRIKETVSKAARQGLGGAAKKSGSAGGFGQGGFGQGGFGQAFEDLLSFAGELRGQASGRMQGELERLAAKLDLVTRREFEAVRAIAIAARAQSEKLAERLEAQLNGKARPAAKKTTPTARKAAPVKPVKKPAPKKAPAKKPVAKKR